MNMLIVQTGFSYLTSKEVGNTGADSEHVSHMDWQKVAHSTVHIFLNCEMELCARGS